jgi:tRNA G10  N-methylase Trm11
MQRFEVRAEAELMTADPDFFIMEHHYLYKYACHEDEVPLCQLELRSLFGGDCKLRLAPCTVGAELNGNMAVGVNDVAPTHNYVLSTVNMDPSRSPFIKQKQELQRDLFKVVYVETTGDALGYSEQRAVEREVGAEIRGKAEMRKPEYLFGIACVEGYWLFGECHTNKAIWLEHNTKPQQYSTALSTRMARAVANITVPFPDGVKAIDPCCGIGTVLIEALSMGIDMIGSDINPLAVRGARNNLAHFGLPEAVAIQDMRDLTGRYDAAVLDMPYNLCSVLSTQEQLAMLESLKRLAGRAVIISTEVIDQQVEQAGFHIVDRCVARKGNFCRHVLVCV